MKRIIVGAAILSLAACGRIETAHVGVRTDFNKTVEMQVMPPGFYTAFFSSVDDYVVKEIEVKFDNLTPKGKDNLILADFDVSIWYQVTSGDVAKLAVKYAGMSAPLEHHDGLAPMFNLVERTARGAVFDVVSQYDSLTIHTKRAELENGIREKVQQDLDEEDKGSFKITRVIVRQIKTDPALEASIQRAVQVQKDTEAKNLEVNLAKAEALRIVAQAEGQAKANKVLSESLTDNFLRYKQIEAMREAAKAGNTIIMPLDSRALVNIPTGK